MNKAVLWGVSLTCWIMLGACDQDVDTETDGGQLADAAQLEQGVDGSPTLDGAPDGQPVADGAAAADGPGGPQVKVIYNGQSVWVALSEPTPVTFEGFSSALLSDVVSLAFPQLAQTAVAADFMAADGFVSSSKSTCDGLVPVAGDLFAKGYVDISTRKLRWEVALGYPGCLYVKDLEEVRLTDK